MPLVKHRAAFKMEASPNTAAPQTEEMPKSSPLPNVGDLIFVGVCQLLLYMRPNYLFSDGSTGWHLVTGQHVLTSHAIPRVDLMSYTFTGKPWVAYEWLSDAIMAFIVNIGGLGTLACVVALSIALLVLSLYQRMRSEGAHFAACMFFSLVGLIASANHWLVRPHLFTFWGVYLFYVRLEDFYRNKISAKRLFAWLLPTMLIWVNCHPAFLFGFAICGLYLCVTTGSALAAPGDDSLAPYKLSRAVRTKQAVTLLVLLVALVATTFINPYGIELYKYIREYLHGTSILAVTDEFKSPDFKGNLHAIFLEILMSLFALGLFLRGRVTVPTLAMCIAFNHLALTSVRNISLYATVVLPALGRLFATAKGSWLTPSSPLGKQLQKFQKATGEFDKQERVSNYHLLPILYAVVVLVMTVFALPGAVKSTFDPEIQPVATLDYIAQNKLPAEHGFNFDNWGGIIRYKLNMPVYIDDRADFYGEQFYQDYGRICETKPGWQELLDKKQIDWILFPKESFLANALKLDKNWQLKSSDQASVLYTRVK
ncbi:MAG: hypothetical protein IPP57_12460 [Candidatus Obscuribacter sp.]|nr:hypothetical protein [Candidatus Obscuribacter sp.]